MLKILFRLITIILVNITINMSFVHGEVANFNEAFASSILSTVESLVAEPWNRILDIGFSSFSSGPSYVYVGKSQEVNVDKNNTVSLLWNLFRPVGVSIDWVYIGLTDSSFSAYAQPGTLVSQVNRNYTLNYYVNSTDQVTGKIDGPSSSNSSFDCTGRPWYTKSEEGGSIWTDPYPFIDDGALGITAALQLTNSDGLFLGVMGADYRLSSIENILVTSVADTSSVVFIINEAGLMISASIEGASLDDENKQVRANESSIDLIRLSALQIETLFDHNWTKANGVLLTIDVPGDGVYFAQSNELFEEHGLYWNVIVAEPVSCSSGFFITKEIVDVLDNDICSSCPSGARCEGGDLYPYPEDGHWIDRSDDTFKHAVYECFWETCLGFKANMKHKYLKLEKHNHPVLLEYDNFQDYFDYITQLCWTKSASSNSSLCDDEALMCATGSYGPLCGSCEDNYVFNSGVRGCVHCDSVRTQVPIVIAALFLFIFIITVTVRVILIRSQKQAFDSSNDFTGIDSLSYHQQQHGHKNSGGGCLFTVATCAGNCKSYILSLTPFVILSHLDRGMLKVLFTTMQIVSTASWNLSVEFPSPFSGFLEIISFLQLDFFEVKCLSKHSNFMHRVLAVSFAPLFLAILNYTIYLIRLHRPCYSQEKIKRNYNETLKDKRSQLIRSTTTSGIQNRAKRTSLFSDIMTAAFGRRQSEISPPQPPVSPHSSPMSNQSSIDSPNYQNNEFSSETMSPLSLNRHKDNSHNSGGGDNGGVKMYKFPEHIGAATNSIKLPPPVSTVSATSSPRFTAHNLSSMDMIKAKLHDENRARRVANEHINFVLLLSYLVLPHVSLIQFSALECFELNTGESYLSVDTSVDCNSSTYKRFVFIDALLIVAFQSIPLLWFFLLWRVRHKLDPSSYSRTSDRKKTNTTTAAAAFRKSKKSKSTSASSVVSKKSSASSHSNSNNISFKFDQNTGVDRDPTHEIGRNDEDDDDDAEGEDADIVPNPRFLGAQRTPKSKSVFQSFSPTSFMKRTSNMVSGRSSSKMVKTPFFWSFRDIDDDILGDEMDDVYDNGLYGMNGDLKEHPLTRALKLNNNNKHSITQRLLDPTIYHLVFLWQDYHPSRWYYEVFDMYRRIMFIAMLPLVSRQSSVRGAIGSAVSVMMIAYVRESLPFIRNATNVILTIGQYQIFAVYFSAFSITSGVFNVLNMDDLALGFLLLGLNLMIVLFAGLMCIERYSMEKEHRSWRKRFTDNELDIINDIMINEDEINRIVGNSISSIDGSPFKEELNGAEDSVAGGDGNDDKVNESREPSFVDNTFPSRKDTYLDSDFSSNTANGGSVKKSDNNPTQEKKLSKIASWFVEKPARKKSSMNAIELPSSSNRFGSGSHTVKSMSSQYSINNLRAISQDSNMSSYQNHQSGPSQLNSVSSSMSISSSQNQHGSHHHNKEVLRNFLLKPRDIRFMKKVGAGSFGEVFKGTCLGQPVAIKTMLHVTEENVKSFRSEILLTARLRHPNIVNFVGACWGRELTCLVLEWVPKGSLQQLLEHPRRSCLLRWDDPLLKLATDIARGMNYLHTCEYYDESDRSYKKCILHRDLKPDNVLVTDFISSKITDFGTSRAKGLRFVTMTAVGTPLFCAPELARGENYDETADVYSFGLVLLNMAVSGSLIEFIGEKWRLFHKKNNRPKQPMRFIRQMNEEGWRPIGLNDLKLTPRSIVNLIVNCCEHDPTQRPKFDEVLRVLEVAAAEEINNEMKTFAREDIETATATFDAETVKNGQVSNSMRNGIDQQFGSQQHGFRPNRGHNRSTANSELSRNSSDISAVATAQSQSSLIVHRLTSAELADSKWVSSPDEGRGTTNCEHESTEDEFDVDDVKGFRRHNSLESWNIQNPHYKV